jgi:NAD(P)H-nitrite reductase large subunit
MRRTVREFRGTEGKIRSVLLDSGELLDADVCVIGAGIIPNTKFIEQDGITKERDGRQDIYIILPCVVDEI